MPTLRQTRRTRDPSRTVVATDQLGFAYRSGIWVLQACTLQVTGGRVLALLGPNGSGKTTLLKLLAGVLTPTTGTVHVEGRVGYVPQLMSLPFAYSVFDTVLMGRARHVGLFATPTRTDEQATWAALDHLGLTALAPGPFDQLSGGERQLVVFARALAAGADVLVLDEPTASLDAGHQEMILRLIRRLARDEGFTVIFSTHQPQLLMSWPTTWRCCADRTMCARVQRERCCLPTAYAACSVSNFSACRSRSVGSPATRWSRSGPCETTGRSRTT